MVASLVLENRAEGRLPDLAAPERRVIGREIPIRRAKGALQLDGVALRERRHGLQPERRRLGGVRP